MSKDTTTAPQGIFRENALRQFHLLDENHVLLQLITPRAWMVLAAGFLALAGLLVFSALGRFPLTVPANGIMMPVNSLYIAISAQQPGTLAEIRVKPGQAVHQGEVLGRIANPALDETLRYAIHQATESERSLNEFVKEYRDRERGLAARLSMETAMLDETIAGYRQALKASRTLLDSKAMLLRKQYITPADYEQSRLDYNVRKEALARALLDRQAAGIRHHTDLRALEEKLDQYQQHYTASQHDLQVSRLEQNASEKLVSSHEGTVIGVAASIGETVLPGKTLVSMITRGNSDTLNIIAFVSHSDGKKITQGMTARVLPDTFNVFEHGYLLASVEEVSPYPVSRESIYPLLGNMQLADHYFQEGPPFMVRLSLLKSENQGKYRWTSHHAPSQPLMPGTTTSLWITRKSCTLFELLSGCDKKT